MFGSIEVGKDNLRRIIGPGGSVIKGLEADSASRLSIDDAGLVHIYAPSRTDYQTAVGLIEGITGASIKVDIPLPIQNHHWWARQYVSNLVC